GGSVGVDHVDAYAPAADAGDHLAQRLRGATAVADYLAEVLRVDPDLQPLAAAGGDQVDAHVVRVLDDAPDEVLERGLEQLRPPASRPGTRPGSRPGSRRWPCAGPACAAWWPRRHRPSRRSSTRERPPRTRPAGRGAVR